MKVRDFFKKSNHRTKRYFTLAERKAFDRDGWRCHYCGSDDALTADHVIPKAHGGTDEASNLVACCRTCNTSKGKKSYDDFREVIAGQLAAFEMSYLPGWD